MTHRKLICVAVFLSVALGGDATLAQSGSGIPILAHYVSWHSKVDGANSIVKEGTVLPCRSDLNPVGLPCPADVSKTPKDATLIGYDALDTNIIREHNAEFTANGMSPLTSWWEASTISGDRFLDAYLSVPSQVQTALLYEVTGQLLEGSSGSYAFDDSANGRENHRRFVGHMTYLHQKYFTRYPNRFVRIDGRPVVFIWLSSAFIGDFASAAKEVKAKIPLYIVCSEINAYAPGRPGLMDTINGCDAISAYGVYFRELTTKYGGNLTMAYTAEYMTGLMRWSQWARLSAPHLKIIAPVMFAFHDSRGNPPLTSTPEQARTFARVIRSMLEDSARQCGNFLWMILFVSHNEHYEGSSAEPTYRYGTTYLDILREIFAHAGPPPRVCS